MCSRFHQKPEAVQTVKLTYHHRAEALGSRYAGFVHRNEPNRPHISSDTIDFKERRDKISEKRRILLGAPRLIYLCFLVLRLVALRPVWRPVERLSAAGEGVFTDWAGGPQGLFSRKMTFFW